MLVAPLVYFIYAFFFQSAMADPETKFDPIALARYNGDISPLVYTSLAGLVFDVTRDKETLFGIGKPYYSWAGRDASRAAAMGSTDVRYITRITEPIDTLEGLTPQQQLVLLQEAKDFHKYPIVGTLHNRVKTGMTKFDPMSLAHYNGDLSPLVYTSLSGLVFDVSKDKETLFGIGKPYYSWAGRDASRAAAMGSTDVRHIRFITDPIDTLEGLTFAQTMVLKHKTNVLLNAYPLVGTLHNRVKTGN